MGAMKFVVCGVVDEWTCPPCREMQGREVPQDFKPHAHCVRRQRPRVAARSSETVVCRCEVVPVEGSERERFEWFLFPRESRCKVEGCFGIPGLSGYCLRHVSLGR